MEKEISPQHGPCPLLVYPEVSQASGVDVFHYIAVSGPWKPLFAQEPGRFVPMAQTVEEKCSRTTVQAFHRAL